MAAKKHVTVKHTVEIDEDLLVALYTDWHAMHALRCEVGHHSGDDCANASGTVHLSPGYMTEGAVVANVFGDDLSDEDFDRIAGKIETELKTKPGLYELTELAKGGLTVVFGEID